jgi:hypothetical protein
MAVICVGPDEIAQPAQQAINIGQPLTRIRWGSELAQPPNGITRAQGLRGDVCQGFANARNVRIGLRQKPIAGLRVINHGAQGLIKLMRNSTGQLADGGQPGDIQ